MKYFYFLLFSVFIYACNFSSYSLLSKEKKVKSKIYYEDRKPVIKFIASHIKFENYINNIVCDIGGGDGLAASILADALPNNTIFHEVDLPISNFNKNSFSNTFKFFGSSANIENFKFLKSTKTSTQLESNKYKHIVLMLSIHEFENKEVMLKDISRIMHPEGKIYISESVYLDSLIIDEGCKMPHLKEDNFYNLINNNFIILKDTTFGKNALNSNDYTKVFICSKKDAN